MMNNFDIILFDFDDTLWARKTDNDSLITSIENICLLNKLAKNVNCTIISGNTYDVIRKKLFMAIDYCDFNFDIWADANSTLYKHDEKCAFIDDFSIDTCKETIFNFLNKYNLKYQIYGYPDVVNIKIKPLNELERNLLVDLFNSYKRQVGIRAWAYKTGTTTVDILSTKNRKDKLLETEYFKNFSAKKSLYVGDECYNGNDKDICKKCSEYINVQDVRETNTLLKLLLGE